MKSNFRRRSRASQRGTSSTAWLEQQQVLASPSREAMAGWSAIQGHGSDGDGGWQGWGLHTLAGSHQAWLEGKGWQQSWQSRQEVFRGNLLLAAVGRRQIR